MDENTTRIALRVAARFQKLAKRIMPRVNWKKTITGDKMRFRYADHPTNMAMIEELPGKPLKKKVRRAYIDTSWYVQALQQGGPFLITNVLADAKLSPSMSYDQAVKAMEKALDKAKETAIKDGEDKDRFKRTGFENLIDEETVHYLNVEPANYAPIKFEGKDFSGTAEWESFEFSADRDEDEDMQQMEGMRAFYKSKSAGGARKLFKLLKADPSKIKNMSVDQFTALLAKNKIAYDYVPTVWR